MIGSWYAAIAIMGFVLLQAGGLDAVQRSVVMLGLPILAILIVNAIAFIKAVTHREIFDQTLSEEDKKLLLESKKEEF